MRKLPVIALFSLLGSVTTLFGTSTTDLNCASGQTLTYYISSYTSLTPCTIGILSYKNFSLVSSSGGVLQGSDIGINLDPGGLGFNFSFPTRLYNGDRYLISYQVDPAPILAGESLKLGDLDNPIVVEPTAFATGTANPPVFNPVSVSAAKWACADAVFSNSPQVTSAGLGSLVVAQNTFSCIPGNTSPYFLQVGPGGSQSVIYTSPASFAEVRVLFQLSGQVPQISTVTTSVLTIPEPGSMAMLGGGIAAMLVVLRRRKA